MDIVSFPLASIRRYPGNPRRNAATVRKLADGIAEFGFLQPLVLDADHVIVVGDTRYLAAQRLKLAQVPCVVAAHLTPDQLARYRLFDNRVGEDSEWDHDKLLAEINALSAGGRLGLTGFEDLELADLVARDLGSALPVDPDEISEEVAAAAVAVVSQVGDIWALGEHRLACGDSCSAELVAAVIDGAPVNLMVTDPPYGVEYDPDWRADALLARGCAAGKVLNDDRADWRQAWALFPGNIAYVWHACLYTAEVVASLRAVGFVLRGILVWVKNRHVISRGHYHRQYEPCVVVDRDLPDLPFTAEHEPVAYAVKDGATADWKGGRKQSTVWEITHQKSETGHGTQKPVEAMRRPILNHTEPGDYVYEPFSGSGTTLIAAELTGRRCLAVELNPAYVDLAVRRWETLTGKRAVLLRSGGSSDRAGLGIAELSAAGSPSAVADEVTEAAPPRRRRSSKQA